MTVQDLPTLNVGLNALASIFLLSGWWAIKVKKISLHKKFMLMAFTTSSCFLASYLYYHFNVKFVTTYEGEGIWRYVYYTILFTHIPAATFSVPPVFLALWHGLKGNFAKHTRITRWLLPLWLYVSVTGIIVYFMLYVF
ncbi:DUF420 domain-containing protein [Candidatus Uabimicrobium sp. HlEnr_7]|uniref:DUF420 domain-containing protein n=1 Tax=Candidatus Uabimicrobium helgolandensis TaxID=3095367 RepID=UPI003556B59B